MGLFNLETNPFISRARLGLYSLDWIARASITSNTDSSVAVMALFGQTRVESVFCSPYLRGKWFALSILEPSVPAKVYLLMRWYRQLSCIKMILIPMRR